MIRSAAGRATSLTKALTRRGTLSGTSLLEIGGLSCLLLIGRHNKKKLKQSDLERQKGRRGKARQTTQVESCCVVLLKKKGCCVRARVESYIDVEA
jgi:hypothetical protein